MSSIFIPSDEDLSLPLKLSFTSSQTSFWPNLSEFIPKRKSKSAKTSEKDGDQGDTSAAEEAFATMANLSLEAEKGTTEHNAPMDGQSSGRSQQRNDLQGEGIPSLVPAHARADPGALRHFLMQQTVRTTTAEQEAWRAQGMEKWADMFTDSPETAVARPLE